MLANCVTRCVLLGAFVACASPSQPPAAPRAAAPPTLFVHGSFTALGSGGYDGDLEVASLLAHGDVGIGALDRLGGELIVVDGVAYGGTVDAATRPLAATARVPYATVAPFQPTIHRTFAAPDAASLSAALDAALPINHPLAVRIHGRFAHLTTRSVAPQTPPYRTIDQVLHDQVATEHADITGTLVGLRLPSYARGLGAVGWHFHFIDDAHQRGGHALAFSAAEVAAEVAVLSEIHVHIPEAVDGLRLRD